MKKTLFLMIGQSVILLFFLASCSTMDSETSDVKETSDVSEITEKENKSDEKLVEDSTEDGEEQVEEITIEEESEEIPLYTLNNTNWTVEPIDKEAEGKLVLLTIDDAPDKFSLEMAKTLKDNKVKAIFFVNGHFIQSEEKKKLLKEIYDLGFPIGNHTMSHSNLKNLSEKDQYKEIIELNHQIEAITGEKPKFFRAPFGSNTDYSKKLVAEQGMLLMNWSYGYDWEEDYMNKDALADIMVNTPLLTNGSNLLMHDREWTNKALPKIIEGLKSKGYTIIDPTKIKIS
ncbi:polysaccharide deacetylase family protein [Metabacillus litoralis]|uniref:polysaccharide deacetylase family protein n=1 Tax=Metabacillus litoralis TaxID=152268 RepID=UPI001CFF4FB6|nr:polysaccharide deacetylase family protein [Metabacillus litoralis]